MQVRKWALISAAGLGIASIATAQGVTNKTFRTTAWFNAFVQDPSAGIPAFTDVSFAGWNLVNLTMGRAAKDTNFPNQVLCMTINCDLSAASLVVYDRSTSNVVATIAASVSLDSVKGEGISIHARSNEVARFVGQFPIGANGNAVNGLLAGGYFTVAARIHLDPATGCPKAVLLKLNKDKQDSALGDEDVSPKQDPAPKEALRAGFAHVIGVVDAITDSKTNTVLVPFGHLSIRGPRPVVLPPG